MTEMKWTINNSNVSNDTDEIDRLAECRAKFGNRPKWATIVKDAMIDNVYYAAMQSTKTGRIWALIVNTHVNDKDFFYNAMNETNCPYPYFCFCPKFVLKRLSPTDNKRAHEWRKRCYQYHERQLRKKVFGKRLDTEKQIHVTLPDDYNGTNYQPGETLLLIKYDKETWLEPIKKLTFSNDDVCEYDFTVIE